MWLVYWPRKKIFVVIGCFCSAARIISFLIPLLLHHENDVKLAVPKQSILSPPWKIVNKKWLVLIIFSSKTLMLYIFLKLRRRSSWWDNKTLEPRFTLTSYCINITNTNNRLLTFWKMSSQDFLPRSDPNNKKNNKFSDNTQVAWIMIIFI